jgi:hypothetical protein
VTTLTVPQAEAAARQALAAGRFEEVETLTRALLVQGRGPLPVWMMLVTALRKQGKHAEALPILEHLSAMVPQNYEIHFDLAEMYLLFGDFERGWKEYRFRYQLQHTRVLDRKVQLPLWEGQDIAGKTLLIHDEQGFGDTFQFMRMVRWAKIRSGARIVLQVATEQRRFAEQLNAADEIILRGELPPPFDYHCRMMDLPMAMGLKLSDLPGEPMPYLKADPSPLKRWRKELTGLKGPLVALCWAGRPEHFNDANRSMSLATLAPLAQTGATYLSIQKGPKAVEARTPPAGMTLVDLSDGIADFADTAAILTLADLLISIDSSPVHLAGALGRPAWVMLPFAPDWRWLIDRSDSPWYPSLKLFRQSSCGDWNAVVKNIMAEMATF